MKTRLNPSNLRHQKQPEGHSCMATVIAMLLNKPVAEVMDTMLLAGITIPLKENEAMGYLVKNDFYPVEVSHGFGFVFEPGRVYIGQGFGKEMMHAFLFYYDPSDGMFQILDPKLESEMRTLPEHVNFSLMRLHAVYDCAFGVAV